MFLCYFWLIAGILLFFLITECTRGDGPHAVGPTIWQLFSRHKPAYSNFPHETYLQDSTFFFLLSDDFCKEQDPHYFYLRPSCPVAMSSVNFYPNKIACSSEQSSPGVNLIPCHLFYITWNWILKLLLMLCMYWDHFWNNVLFSMSNSVGIWHLLGSKSVSFTFFFVVDSKTKNSVSCHKPKQTGLFVIIYTGHHRRCSKDWSPRFYCA